MYRPPSSGRMGVFLYGELAMKCQNPKCTSGRNAVVHVTLPPATKGGQDSNTNMCSKCALELFLQRRDVTAEELKPETSA